MLGTAADFTRYRIDLEPLTDEPAEQPRRSPPSRMTAVLAGVLKDFDPGFYRAGAVILGLVSISTVLLWLMYKKPGMSLLDALYFSTETVATVGYGDFNFIDQSPLLRMWAIFLMIAGVTTIAMLMAFLSDMLISRRLESFDRPPPGPWHVRARRGDRSRVVRDSGGRRTGRRRQAGGGDRARCRQPVPVRGAGAGRAGDLRGCHAAVDAGRRPGGRRRPRSR